MEILNLRLTANGYLVNGITEVPNNNKEALAWVNSGREVMPMFTEEETAKQEKEKRKAEIAQQLADLTITTSKGSTFDANNQARLDMQNGIEAAKTTKELIDLGVLPAETEWETTKWRLANDSEVVITLMELKEASLLAIKKYAEVKGIV